MKDEIKKYLYDILIAAEEISKFTQGLSFDSFMENLMVQKAVEREFEIIGEALNRIKDEAPSVLDHISEFHKIIGFRNVLVHGYDIIDEKLVWDAVVLHLPILVKEIRKILES